MLGNNYFYHKTVRRIITIFGTLFNDISIVKTDANGSVLNQIKVPLSYGPKNSTLKRIFSRNTPEDDKFAIKLPRMSFEITSMSFNPEQRLGNIQSMTHKVTRIGDDPLITTAKRSYVYVPYKLSLSLTAYSNTQDDVLQITEQILPYFNPDFTVTVKNLPDLDSVYDIPFTLVGISPAIEYEGDPMSRNLVTTSFDFETEARFYGPISEGGIIKKVIATIGDYDNHDSLYERITVEAIADATQEEGYSILETYEDLQ